MADLSVLMPIAIVLGAIIIFMLGLAAARSIDKRNKVNSDSLK